jgi:serine/threonine protein kinase
LIWVYTEKQRLRVTKLLAEDFRIIKEIKSDLNSAIYHVNMDNHLQGVVTWREINLKQRTSGLKGRVTSILRDFQMMAILRHPHIMTTNGLTLREAQLGIVGPMVEINLQQIWDTGTAATAQYAHLSNQLGCLASAVAFIHDAGICHDDISPSNVLLSQGRLMLSGFGQSHFGRTSEQNPVPVSTGASGSKRKLITERKTDRQKFLLDRSYDIWSLGCVYIDICTLRLRPQSIEDSRSVTALGRPSKRLQELQSIDPYVLPPHQLSILARMIATPSDGRPTAGVTAADLARCFPCDHSEKPSEQSLKKPLVQPSVHALVQPQEKHSEYIQPTEKDSTLRTGVYQRATLQAANGFNVNSKVLEWIHKTQKYQMDHGLFRPLKSSYETSLLRYTDSDHEIQPFRLGPTQSNCSLCMSIAV